ncbi:sigma-70 family RNA polymerase sigma factor [Actinoplanes sp. CA-015351]|uniref:sigma-70 family RNA polymerase sigma factor n=1 Tax=Actinoplanes sp. CA-015351 TaxID=3239897 RepID=UPI003D97A878
MKPQDREFTEWVTARRDGLVRMAALLTSGDRSRAEDAVQAALTKLYLRWARLRPETLDAYARRCVVNATVDEHRSLFRRRERTFAELPDVAALEDMRDDDRVITMLRALPAGMRAAVVLRYVEGLSVAETAAAMRCSEGNVKSQSARGLQHLRDLFPAGMAAQLGDH